MKLLPVKELGLIGLRTMKTNVLGANQILASRGILGDLELKLRHTPRTPRIRGEISVFIAKSLFPDLESFSITLVLLDISSGCLGHD